MFGWGVNTISGNFLLLCEENIYRRHILCFQLTFFDFPAAKNFEEFLGADLSISETSSLPADMEFVQNFTPPEVGTHCHYF